MAKILSYFAGCLFTWTIVSFDVQKVLNLMKLFLISPGKETFWLFLFSFFVFFCFSGSRV
jgi:hypothetical protein